MCAQCMLTATVAASGATGARAWLATRLSRRTLKWVTGALIAAGVLAAGILS